MYIRCDSPVEKGDYMKSIAGKIKNLKILQFDEGEQRLIDKLFPIPFLFILSYVVYNSQDKIWSLAVGLAFILYNSIYSGFAYKNKALQNDFYQLLRLAVSSAFIFFIMFFSGKVGQPWLLSIFIFVTAPFALRPVISFIYSMVFLVILMLISFTIGYETRDLLLIFLVNFTTAHFFNILILYLKKRNNVLQKTLSELDRALNAKSEFLASVSHEIRTPMNAILGTAYLLDGTPLSDQQRNFLAILKNSGGHLIHLIDDILNLSRIEAGKISISNEKFDIMKALTDVESLVRNAFIKNKNIDLTMNIAGDIPFHFYGDSVRIKQLLINLVSNSVKFTDQGKITIGLNWQDPDKTNLLFSVTDTGKGISRENLEKIFEPFEQEEMGVQRKFGGVGLGLSICRKIIHNLGGQIWVESEPGKGSTFYFSIKMEPCENWRKNRVRKQTCQSCAHNPLLDKKLIEETNLAFSDHLLTRSILLVDDDEVNLMVLQAILHKRRFVNIDTVTNAGEALRKMENQVYDFILTDVHMPEINGYALSQKIRGLENQNRASVIIACTADAFDDNLGKCLNSGMNDFIAKPINSEMLFFKLAKFYQATQAAAL
jgi:hypothetical protein